MHIRVCSLYKNERIMKKRSDSEKNLIIFVCLMYLMVKIIDDVQLKQILKKFDLKMMKI